MAAESVVLVIVACADNGAGRQDKRARARIKAVRAREMNVIVWMSFEK
jgi:hypothetical protein